MFPKLFSVVCLLFCFNSAPYSIVFVHIGKKLPSYIHDAVYQARLFNKECEIYVLANKEVFEKNSKRFDALKVNCVPLESLAKTAAHQEFLKKTTLDHHFWGGFWIYACERFFYLADFMDQHDVHDVFHLENDNLLYVDLSEFMPVFRDHYTNKIAAVFDNDQRCIPCFLYIPSGQVMRELAASFLRHASSGKSDMYLLGMFKQDQPSLIDTLPIIMKSYSDTHGLQSPQGDKVVDPSLYFRHIELFNSIFDGAALGQYLDGIDPRNGVSRPGFINESCVFNPSLLRLKWECDAVGREIPMIVFHDEKYRVNNLHIHSKRLHKFLSKKAE